MPNQAEKRAKPSEVALVLLGPKPRSVAKSKRWERSATPGSARFSA
jgi:hypothetical protein